MVNSQLQFRRALGRIKQAHPGAKVEGLHVDYMNGFGCDFALHMQCQLPGCTWADLLGILASVLPCITFSLYFNSKIFISPVDRDIADCVKEFKSRKLPLHGLINNIGVENPHDIKSKEGFDVRSILFYMLFAHMI